MPEHKKKVSPEIVAIFAVIFLFFGECQPNVNLFQSSKQIIRFMCTSLPQAVLLFGETQAKKSCYECANN